MDVSTSYEECKRETIIGYDYAVPHIIMREIQYIHIDLSHLLYIAAKFPQTEEVGYKVLHYMTAAPVAIVYVIVVR